MIASTQIFDRTLVDTVIKQNINPIEVSEAATLLVASTVLDLPVQELVTTNHLDRLARLHPLLFGDAAPSVA